MAPLDARPLYELSDFDGQSEAIPLSNHSVIDHQVELFALLSLAAVAHVS